MNDIPQGRGYTLLCVEDEADILTELTHGLTKSGFTVLSAGSGEEALAILQTERPDLILCDVLMPGFGGLELLERTRANFPHLHATPFIFLSALADRSHILEGLKLGADDYLTKPVDFDLLETKIIRNLEFVKRTRGVPVDHRDATAVKLTKREREVLAEFANGHTNAKVAEILGISEHTIGDHSKAIFKKLAVSTRTHAVRKAIALGIIAVGK